MCGGCLWDFGLSNGWCGVKGEGGVESKHRPVRIAHKKILSIPGTRDSAKKKGAPNLYFILTVDISFVAYVWPVGDGRKRSSCVRLGRFCPKKLHQAY